MIKRIPEAAESLLIKISAHFRNRINSSKSNVSLLPNQRAWSLGLLLQCLFTTCLGRPCRNNGTCFPAAPRRLPSAAAYRCVCPPGVTGASCQVRAASAPRPRARPCPWASPRCLRTAPSRPRAAGASLSVPAAGRASGPQPCPRRGRAAGRRGGRLEEPRQRRPRAVAAAQPALSLGSVSIVSRRKEPSSKAAPNADAPPRLGALGRAAQVLLGRPGVPAGPRARGRADGVQVPALPSRHARSQRRAG